MPFVHVEDPADPRLADFRAVPDAALLADRGWFVAEGRLLVRRLLESTRYATRAVVVTEAARLQLGDVLERAGERLPVYVVAPPVLGAVAGFNFHRGALAVGIRRRPCALEELLATAPPRVTVVALDGVTDADNVGAIFRNAAAFGAAGVVLGPGCVDPLYRKALRTSMGAALRLPFVRADDWVGALERMASARFTLVALTPDGDLSVDALAPPERLCLLVGAEGTGLGEVSRTRADCRVRIDMASGVDSLNVATATGIALHRLAAPGTR